MVLDFWHGIWQMFDMKTMLLVAVLMLGAVGCDSEKPPMFTEEELQREFDALDREAEQEELEKIHQSPEYKAWLAEGEAMKRRHEAENSRPIQFYTIYPDHQTDTASDAIDEQRAANERLRRQMATENERLRQEMAEQREELDERAEKFERKAREIEQAAQDAERMRHNDAGLGR